MVVRNRECHRDVASASGEAFDHDAAREPLDQIEPATGFGPEIARQRGLEVEPGAIVDYVKHDGIAANLERRAQRSGRMAHGIADKLGKDQTAHGELLVVGFAPAEQAAKILVAHRVRRTRIGGFKLPAHHRVSEVHNDDGDVVARRFAGNRALDELGRIGGV